MVIGFIIGVCIIAGIIIGAKIISNKIKKRNSLTEEQIQAKIELEKDAQKYLHEEKLFDKELYLPYEDKTTKTYQPRDYSKKNKNNDLER